MSSPPPTVVASELRIALEGTLKGWAHGVGPAVLRVRIESNALPAPRFEDELQRWVRPTLPRPPVPPGVPEALAWLLYWTSAMQHAAGMDVLRVGCLVDGVHAPHPEGRWEVAVPCPPERPGVTTRTLEWVAQCLDGRRPVDQLEQGTLRLLDQLRRLAPPGKNTRQFLRAAEAADMPWSRLAEGYYRYGWGALSRLLNSTFTDRTPVLGTQLARDKLLTARVLRRAGLPTAPHRLVDSADEAVRAAERLGWPAVVKPADLDRGIGVAAGLRDAAAVRRAYAEAVRHSSRVLVEKHMAGQDYRLMTFRGELIWSILRQPGGVTGDGHASVRQLIDQVNRDPRRGRGPQFSLQALALDEEALELLAEQALQAGSVPEAGRFVRLRRIANMTAGGTGHPVNDQVHPDNRELALQAAEALHLDLAGIDLLIPDIAVSWRTSGASICEVNAQPQMGGNSQTHVHGQILGALVHDGGRIPLVLVLGAAAAPLADALAAALAPRLRRLRPGLADAPAALAVGRVQGGQAWLGAVQQGQHAHVHDAIAALLAHRHTGALVVAIEDDSLLASGLPFDRAELLVLQSALPRPGSLARLLALLRPAADAAPWFDAADLECATAAAAWPGARVLPAPPLEEPAAAASGLRVDQLVAALEASADALAARCSP